MVAVVVGFELRDGWHVVVELREMKALLIAIVNDSRIRDGERFAE
jgi:hypothetical protein